MIMCLFSVENFDKIWTDLAPEDSPCGTPPGAHEFSAFQVMQLLIFGSPYE